MFIRGVSPLIFILLLVLPGISQAGSKKQESQYWQNLLTHGFYCNPEMPFIKYFSSQKVCIKKISKSMKRCWAPAYNKVVRKRKVKAIKKLSSRQKIRLSKELIQCLAQKNPGFLKKKYWETGGR